MPLSTIEEAVRDIRDGKMIIIVDDEDRENEGDLVCAAEKVTPDIINFMAVHGRGQCGVDLEQRIETDNELLPQLSVARDTFFAAQRAAWPRRRR